MRLWRLLRSPRLALGELGLLALYCALAAWAPWLRTGAATPPAWAAALHLDRPFSSPLFLLVIGLLMLSTLACTWDRTFAVARLARGLVRGQGLALPARADRQVREFLADRGFGRVRDRAVAYRYRAGLWGGWLFHVGLLALLAGIVTQQGFHDGGAFEVAEGELVRLDAPGIVFARQRGPFAAAAPPDLSVGLLGFDPFMHQRGYAPDRASRLRIERAGEPATETVLDRAAGANVGASTIFQAIPSGLALVLELPGEGGRAVHLRNDTPTRASASVVSPAGQTVVLGLDSERPTDDRAGTGTLLPWIQAGVRRQPLVVGEPFDFGGRAARLTGVVRWGGFTYTVDPGLPAVFAGFALVLAGATLMTLPAGAAEIASEGGQTAAWVYVTRGREELCRQWLGEDSGEEES